MQKEPLILTLRLDKQSQAFFDSQREKYFPPERNYLKAHFTLFHHLPNETEITDYLKTVKQEAFEIQMTGLMNLGAGVAYRLQSQELMALRDSLKQHFTGKLTPQDQQGFRPHITIQNKVLPAQSSALLATLSETFQPFPIQALGLDIWTYLGCPWRHELSIPFYSNKPRLVDEA